MLRSGREVGEGGEYRYRFVGKEGERGEGY